MNNPDLDPANRGHCWLAIALFSIVVIVCLGAYWPGLNGPFLFDDYHNLEPLKLVDPDEPVESAARFIFNNQSGSLGRPVSMATFLLNDNAWPSDARGFKYTNLMLHLLCGILLFGLTRSLARMAGASSVRALYVGVLCAALWLLHPLHVSTVLYVIQRMTQLAALFALAGLWSYCAGRRQLQRRPRTGLALMIAAFVPFAVLATLSKENGILICAFVLVIEFAFNQNVPRSRAHKWVMYGMAAVPLLLLAAYLASKMGTHLRGFESRSFSLTERLLTEPRILMDYLRLIFAYRPWGTGLFHDDIHVSTGLFSPATTLLSWLAIAGLIISAVICRRRVPVLSFAVLWFFAGHLLESTFLPLELYFEHRNYLPMVGPLFAVSWHFTGAITHASDRFVQTLLSTASLVVIGLFTVMLGLSVKQWSSPVNLLPSWEVEHPNSLRAKRTAATFFNAAGDPGTSIRLLKDAIKLEPRDYGAHIQAMDIACTNGMELPFNVEELTMNPVRYHAKDGLTHNITQLSTHIADGSCEDLSPKQMHALFSTIESRISDTTNSKRAAKIYFAHAEFYKSQGDFNGTMLMLEKTWQKQPTPTIAMITANTLASAGLIKEAAKWLERAKQADSQRSWGVPSQRDDIESLSRRILTQ